MAVKKKELGSRGAGTPAEIARRVRKLRQSYLSEEMTQAEFAGVIGVDQSRISQWEAGSATPSADALIKLGNLALKGAHDASEALFFWRQTGLASEMLLSMAGELLKLEEPGTRRLLAVAETILKQQLREQDVKVEGKGVLIPPFAEGPWEVHRHAPRLLMPAELVHNRNSTYYVTARTPERWDYRPRGFLDGDIVVFDALATEKFGHIQGRRVLLNFLQGENPSWPEGLFLGHLSLTFEGAGNWSVRLANLDASADLASSQNTLGRLVSFNVDSYISPEHRQLLEDEQRDDRRDPSESHWKMVERAALSLALAKLWPPKGCQILGRFIALFGGQHVFAHKKELRGVPGR